MIDLVRKMQQLESDNAMLRDEVKRLQRDLADSVRAEIEYVAAIEELRGKNEQLIKKHIQQDNGVANALARHDHGA